MLTSSIVPALVTPLTAEGAVDRAACARLVEHVLAGGVDAVLALGSTGESATLGAKRRAAALEAFTDAVAGRVPVAVGVTEPSLVATLEQAQQACDAGVVAIVVTPPYYAPVDQATVVRHYEAVAAATSVHLLGYNIPSFTKTWLEPETTRTLLERGVLHGVKDSSADLEYMTQLMRVVQATGREDVGIWTGMDTLLLPALLLGANGAIAASSNLAPRLSVDLVAAVRRSDLDAARALQRTLVELILTLRSGPLPTGIKTALDLVGICRDTPAEPLAPTSAETRSAIHASLGRLGITASVDSAARR